MGRRDACPTSDAAWLCTVSQALGMAEGMTNKGVHPKVTLVETTYAKGIRLTKKQMKPYAACLDRLPGLGNWFLTITAAASLAGAAQGS